MKSDQFQTASIVIAAMLLGSGLTWFLLRDRPQPNVPAPAVAPAPRPEATSSVKPPGLNPRVAEQAVALDDDALEKAIASAKAARRAGTLTPLARTPEEFARVLGKWNFAIHEFVRRYPAAPDESASEFAVYRRDLDKLTADLANLLSDEELMTRLNVETPAQRARYQANLAAGSLDLDPATAAKIEALLATAYVEVTRPPVDKAGLEKKIEAMNAKLIGDIEALLTPEQRARLDAMGVARVLLGETGGENE